MAYSDSFFALGKKEKMREMMNSVAPGIVHAPSKNKRGRILRPLRIEPITLEDASHTHPRPKPLSQWLILGLVMAPNIFKLYKIAWAG